MHKPVVATAELQEPTDRLKANGGNDLSVRLMAKLISTASPWLLTPVSPQNEAVSHHGVSPEESFHR